MIVKGVLALVCGNFGEKDTQRRTRIREVLERALTVLSDQELVPLEPLLLFASSEGR